MASRARSRSCNGDKSARSAATHLKETSLCLIAIIFCSSVQCAVKRGYVEVMQTLKMPIRICNRQNTETLFCQLIA